MSAQDNLNGQQFYHASDKRFRPGQTVSGGHRLDDLYIADQPHVAASYYSSGHVYEVSPDAEPVPSREHEYTVPSARVVRKLSDREVLDSRTAHYNSPVEKAKRDRVNSGVNEHMRRMREDPEYKSRQDRIARRMAGYDD